jgi:hypothetical protein
MLFVGGSGDYYLTLRKASAAGGSPFIFLMQKLGLENLRLGSLHNSRGEKLTLFLGRRSAAPRSFCRINFSAEGLVNISPPAGGT